MASSTTSAVRTVFAGPWVGEFGWELCMWQGWLRRRARTEDIRIVVSSRPGHELLYEDFAADFVPFVPPQGQPDCANLRAPLGSYRPPCSHDEWWNPVHGHGGARATKEQGCPVICEQDYVSFGRRTEPEFDVLIHARARKWGATGVRNWPMAYWLELISSFPHDWGVGWIGTREEALAHGGEDLRGVPLRELVRCLHASRLVVGPSSGPMHLASICRVPHVVWSGNARDGIRYRKCWNPFGTQHTMIPTWQPEVEQVRSAVSGFLREARCGSCS